MPYYIQSLLPHPLSSGSLPLPVFLSVPCSKQVKCLKRCIEVSLRALYDGYVIWHNASEHPSQIKWQMLFFASWIFLGQADFETFCFSLCLSVPPAFSLLFLSSSMTLQSLPFCLSLNSQHNYCVIASDRESLLVDVLLSFLTDTPPSALFSVGVCPSLHRSLLHNMISCVHRREESVSIDTSNNTSVFGLLACGGHIKTERESRGWVEWIPGRALTFLPLFGSLKACPVPEGSEAFWELRLTTWAAICVCPCCLPPPSTAAAMAPPHHRLPVAVPLSIHPGGWMALIGKICVSVVQLTREWQ